MCSLSLNNSILFELRPSVHKRFLSRAWNITKSLVLFNNFCVGEHWADALNPQTQHQRTQTFSFREANSVFPTRLSRISGYLFSWLLPGMKETGFLFHDLLFPSFCRSQLYRTGWVVPNFTEGTVQGWLRAAGRHDNSRCCHAELSGELGTWSLCK